MHFCPNHILLKSSNPRGLYAKTETGSSLVHHKVFLRGRGVNVYLSFDDFAALVEYVLTNTDLDENDPRLALVERIKNSRMAEGSKGKNRIETVDDSAHSK
jgi:hypothetical protein